MSLGQSSPHLPIVEVAYRPVVGFPGYLVSDLGSVWSRWGMGGRKSHMLETWKKSGLLPKGKGYLRCSLSNNGKAALRMIHTLVLEAFVGPCPEGQECRHLDGKPANNQLENLKWGTPKQNQADRLRHGTHNNGARNPMAKLNDDVVSKMRIDAAAGVTILEIAAKFGFRYEAARRAIRGGRWKHLATPPVARYGEAKER